MLSAAVSSTARSLATELRAQNGLNCVAVSDNWEFAWSSVSRTTNIDGRSRGVKNCLHGLPVPRPLRHEDEIENRISEPVLAVPAGPARIDQLSQ